MLYIINQFQPKQVANYLSYLCHFSVMSYAFFKMFNSKEAKRHRSSLKFVSEWEKKTKVPLGASYQLVCSLGGLLRCGGVMGRIWRSTCTSRGHRLLTYQEVKVEKGGVNSSSARVGARPVEMRWEKEFKKGGEGGRDDRWFLCAWVGGGDGRGGGHITGRNSVIIVF